MSSALVEKPFFRQMITNKSMIARNLEKRPSQIGLANYGARAKSGPLPVFVNKVLLEHSHTHLFIYLFSMACKPQSQSWIDETEPKIFTIWPSSEEVCQPLC